MEVLRDIHDIIESEIEPYKPKTAKLLKFFFVTSHHRDRFGIGRYRV